MDKKKSAFRQIFKATSIFGGVQVFNIIISLVRGKLIAVLIGTTGMGLNGLLNSGINLIKIISGLGLEQSAIKDISNASGSNDLIRIRTVYSIFRRWIWITGILGVILTLISAPFLSQLSFGDHSHTLSFILISSTFIFGALTGGIYTLLRGLRKISLLAKASIYGSVLGLFVIIPVYYYWGIKGVVPAIILTSFFSYLVSLYFKRKVPIEIIPITWHETFVQGKGMVFLGISLSVSAILSTANNYLLNAIITRLGSLSDLGLYNAGMTIMSSYVGMIFTAMGMDYFPKLSENIDDEKKWQDVVNQQGEIQILILGPILTLMVATAPILIQIILSQEFMSTIHFLLFASLAIPLKSLVWIQGFIIMAKGENRLFLLTEILANIVFLVLNVLFYKYFGITGLGISMFLGFLVSLIIMMIVAKSKFNFMLSRSLILLTISYSILIGVSISGVLLMDYPRAYLSGFLMVIIAGYIAYKELNKRLDIKDLLHSFISKRNKN
ncbi:oligosaccharide flippase family protein [Carboxylicivirga caseinilyticus]|uniref:oligosaccharide flippase family protein n=1 Tax=Carboxylicivirga caseinilyticus TaxID=3417572 RepID=UPI002AA8EC67|nr:oligosaccharide flippase family protein [uncultured Carboxylicivirga sp.]MCU4166650.1 oligosaccharide flippase family protein [Marinilabiliaceae bacterium A049]